LADRVGFKPTAIFISRPYNTQTRTCCQGKIPDQYCVLSFRPRRSRVEKSVSIDPSTRLRLAQGDRLGCCWRGQGGGCAGGDRTRAVTGWSYAGGDQDAAGDREGNDVLCHRHYFAIWPPVAGRLKKLGWDDMIGDLVVGCFCSGDPGVDTTSVASLVQPLTSVFWRMVRPRSARSGVAWKVPKIRNGSDLDQLPSHCKERKDRRILNAPASCWPERFSIATAPYRLLKRYILGPSR